MGKTKKQPKSKLEFTEDYRPIRKVPLEIKNNAPTEAIDHQNTRKLREILKLKELSKNPIHKRVAKKQSALLHIAEKNGFVKRRGESEEQFQKRILRETTKSINEDMQKVRFGLAGRNLKEIKADYKELDDKAKKKKALKVLQAEKKRKLAENSLFSSDDDEESSSDESVDRNGAESDGVDSSKPEEVTENEQVMQKKKLSKNDKLRLQKKQQKEIEKKELMLDAKEVIPFGARVDAPPQFKGKLNKINHPSAKAGAKNLLLKGVLERNGSRDEPTQAKKPKVDEAQRQRVIDMYRQLKKTRKT